jgi:arylsulfatase A-like enzyme
MLARCRVLVPVPVLATLALAGCDATEGKPADTHGDHTLTGDSADTAIDSAHDTGSDTADTSTDTSTDTSPPVTHPNFVVFYGEARGWTSTSVQQDDRVPDSRSGIFLTPNLDELADAGATFTDFYAPSPRCMPSRAAYLTGKSPARLHMTFVGEGASDGVPTGDVLPPEPLTTLPTSEVTLAALLSEAGYATAHFGKWHAGNVDPTAYGFDESDGPTTNRGPDGSEHPNPTEAFGTAARGIDFMQREVAAGRPFYLQISHYGGGDAVDALPETYSAESARLSGERESDIIDAAILRDMDTSVGQVLAAIRDLGIEGETYVVFTADHGRAGRASNRPLAQGKGTVWEGGVRVPLLVRGPGVPRGVHPRTVASQVDLYPTLAELAGIEGPLTADLEGGSLWGVLTGDASTVARAYEPFVVHFPHYDKDPFGPASSIRVGDEKLTRYYEDGSLHLYDLSADLAEENDLAGLQPDRARALEIEMDAYLSAVGAQMPGHL